MVIFLPILLIQRIGFITIKPKKRKPKQISPFLGGAPKPGQSQDKTPDQNRKLKPGQNGDSKPGQSQDQKPGQNGDSRPGQHRHPGQSNHKDMLYSAYRFYCAPVTKFVVYMVGLFLLQFTIFFLYQIDNMFDEILNKAYIPNI